MRIKRLGLKNYRNLRDVELTFPSMKTLIIGKNAQGKTNILESIYFLSDLKSPRTSTVSDLIKFGEEKFEISAEVEKRIQKFESVGRYKDLVESSYFLNIAIQNAKIEMNSVERVLLKKAYDDFNKALTTLMTKENIEIKNPE